MSIGRVAGRVLWIALFVGACGGGNDEGESSGGCTENSQCTLPAVCVNKVCQVVCAASSDCGDGEFCNVETGVCKPGCKADEECEVGEVCRKGGCFNAWDDADGDGYKALQDCDETNAAVNPGATETCNGIDDNCNDEIDDALPPGDLAEKQMGVCQNAHKQCAGKAGYVEPDYAALFPDYEAVEESCDGKDNDCDGAADNNLVPPPGDKAMGVCVGAVKSCAGASGWQEPDYTAIAGYESYEKSGCDGIDSNCDGTADEQYDKDGDGYYNGKYPDCLAFYEPKGLIDCDDDEPKFGKSCVLYVDDTATGLGDGTSWANAITNLQDGLATSKDGYELWVAEGTYKPDVGVGKTAGSRSATFALKGATKIYGGFQGGETALSQRDFRTHLTVLSGDLSGDDAAGFANRTDNSYHVVEAAGGALLDGVWIRGGNANDNGGAVHSTGPSDDITLANCTLIDNQAATSGGAVYLRWDSKPTLINCRAIGNKAGAKGGAMYTDWSSAPNVYGSLFTGNVAGTNGGAISATWFSTPGEIVNSTFANNTAPLGAAVYFDSAYSIHNTVMFGNSTTPIGGTSSVTVSYSSIQGGALGTGNVNLSASPFIDIDGADNVAGNSDDDLHLLTGSSSIDSGSNALVPSELTEDLDGNARIKGTVDRGAFEKP